jgi:hypothetical protein
MSKRMGERNISDRLLQQRIRNRIIEYLEVASSPDEQRDYERRVPVAQVPAEMIEQWSDSVDAEDLDWYAPPVFSRHENEAIRRFHDVWLVVVEQLPDPLPFTIEALIGTPLWDRLVAAARTALTIFEKRGRLDEEVEQRFDN